VTATEEARDLALLAADAASAKLATDIVLIDVSERLAITDVFLIASGSNERQVEAIVDAVEEKLRAAGRKPLRREGRRDGRWVLLDYADIVIHIQHTEERVFYALERLWKDCAMISIDPRGGGSTEWVQPSAARTAARSAAAADAGGLSLGQTVATAAAADDVAALDDDDLEDNLDDLTDDELAVLVAADVTDINEDGVAEDGAADDDAADDGAADDDLTDAELDGLADDDLDDLDDPGAESDLGDTQAADGDTAGLGRIGFE
jgi:ribosome-associated protein